MPDSIKAYTADDSNKFKTIVVFDCRGVEPVDFSPRVKFKQKQTNTFSLTDMLIHVCTFYITDLL